MTSPLETLKVAARRAAAGAKRTVKPWLPTQRRRFRIACTYLAGDGIEVGALLHVWDDSEFSAALGRIQQGYVGSLAVLEACRNGSENIYILRKAAG